MTKVKICGITNIQDAQHAVACGAEMLGFNFYAKSARYITPEKAAEITASLPSSVEAVGVFVKEPSPDAVREIANRAGVRSVQLHGDEGPEFCADLEDLNVIKVFRVGEAFDESEIVNFLQYRILLDAATPAFGGSGATFDWTIAQRVRQQVRTLILAGGLDARSVGDAIRIVAPDAVDACSRIEREPGMKDQQMVQEFVAAAHVQKLGLAARTQE